MMVYPVNLLQISASVGAKLIRSSPLGTESLFTDMDASHLAMPVSAMLCMYMARSAPAEFVIRFCLI